MHAKSRLVLIVAFVVVLVLMAVVPAAAAPLDTGSGPYHPAKSYGHNAYGKMSYGATYGESSYGHQKSNYGQGACWYKVHWGDTLNKIAWHYGTSSHHLAWLNHLHNPDWIYAGEWLKVPCDD